jgi:hypothetical protein
MGVVPVWCRCFQIVASRMVTINLAWRGSVLVSVQCERFKQTSSLSAWPADRRCRSETRGRMVGERRMVTDHRADLFVV